MKKGKMVSQRRLGRKVVPELGERRRNDLLEATLALVAERGLEGLRTRDVAQRAGVNIATLHYYFGTKEALLADLVRHASERFGEPRTTLGNSAEHEAPPARSGTARKGPSSSLRDHLDSAIRTFKTTPWLMSVMQELAVRAQRDDATRAAFREIFRDWNAMVEHIVRHQVAAGELRSELNVPAAARIVTSFIMGATLQLGVDDKAFDFGKVASELERWAKPRATRG